MRDADREAAIESADPSVRQFVLECYEYFDRINSCLWDGGLPTPLIKLEAAPVGYRHGENVAGLARFSIEEGTGLIALDVGLWTMDACGRGFWQDALMHEAVHMALAARGIVEVEAHGRVFAEECNRIGLELGLVHVHSEACRRNALEHFPEAERWPFSAKALLCSEYRGEYFAVSKQLGEVRARLEREEEVAGLATIRFLAEQVQSELDDGEVEYARGSIRDLLNAIEKHHSAGA